MFHRDLVAVLDTLVADLGEAEDPRVALRVAADRLRAQGCTYRGSGAGQRN